MLDVEGLMKKDAILKMFVKPDKYSLADIATKPPRAIQYRSPKYNLVLSSYLKDFEHKFYQLQTNRSHTPDVAKGRNLVQRASDLLDKSSVFNSPIYVNMDYSKMDSCVRVEHQRTIFRKLYLKKFPSKFFKQVLWEQLNNTGYSKNGIKYKIKGTRCSGDFTTGFENSLINWIIIRYVSLRANVKTEFYVDGDDSVIIMEKSDALKFHLKAHQLIPKLGFDIKLNWASTIEEVDFCQTRLLNCNPPRMARNPVRALSNFNISLKNYPSKVWPRLIQAKADCERFGNPGVPLLQPLGKLFDLRVKPMLDKEQEEFIKLNKHCDIHITDSVRQSYDQSWDVSPYEQELIEQYSNLVPIIGKLLDQPHIYYESVYAQYQTLADSSETIN